MRVAAPTRQDSVPAADSRQRAPAPEGADQRAASVAQRRLSRDINASPKVAQLQQLQRAVNAASPRGETAVNDAPALEAEADTMGAQAVQMQAVVQRRVDPVAGNNDHRSYAWLKAHPHDLVAEGYGDMYWIDTALEGYKTIADSRGVVEEDEDVELLDRFEAELDQRVTQGNQEIANFNAAGHNARIPLVAQLKLTRQAINGIVNRLNAYFRPGGGGFGALGRATEVDGRTVTAGARAGGVGAADQFIANTTLNGVALTATHHVTGGAGHAHEAGPQSILVGGYNNTGLIQQNAVAVRQALGQVAAPAAQQKAADAQFVARDRGEGQAAAMGGTNARGYAWFYNVAGWNTTRWEWLHLRGAGLGGATAGTNLVLGTRDANTQMIPFESNLRSLQNVARDSGNYSGVAATWQANGQVQRHAYNDIQMRWSAPRTQQGVERDVPLIAGAVDIHPLRVGPVLSKAEVRHIEAALQEVRQTVANTKVEMDTEDL